MDVLLKVLKNIEQLRTQREAEKITLDMPADGSTTSAGTTITPSTPVLAPTPLACKEKEQPATSTPPEESSKSETSEKLDWRSRPIRESKEARNALSVLNGTMYLTQKSYNASEKQLEAREMAFQEGLADYCFNDVKAAFESYRRCASDVPTVYDILIILDPPPPVFRESMVIIIKRKIRDCLFVSPDEREYCRGYEQQELRKVQQWKQYHLRTKEPNRIAPLQIEYTRLEEDDADEDAESA